MTTGSLQMAANSWFNWVILGARLFLLHANERSEPGYEFKILSSSVYVSGGEKWAKTFLIAP